MILEFKIVKTIGKHSIYFFGASEKNHTLAQYFVGLYHEINNNEKLAFEYYQNVANKGYVAEKYWSVYHVHCLYAGFGEGKVTDDRYYRPRIHKSQICNRRGIYYYHRF